MFTDIFGLSIIIGLINNVLYVMILVAALDLVGPSVPKGAVLLADITPSLLTKLFAPYFIHAIPYRVRVPIFVTLSTSGMLLIALSPATSIKTKMLGIMSSSLASGAGELSFLGLTHFYGPFSLAAWGSGTGASGLVGAGTYTLATTSLGFSSRGTLLVSAMWPAVMIFSFFFVLPQGPLLLAQSRAGYERVARKDSVSIEKGGQSGNEGLLEKSSSFGPGKDARFKPAQKKDSGVNRFKSNLRRAKSLFIPL
jgi:battenin